MNHIVAIIGPTGTGKSRLALHLAQVFNVEILSADSRQVYRHMDIGTATPSLAEMSLVPHHLFNIINPDEDFSLAQYQELAYRAIDAIHQRNRLPLLVGGSGQLVWAILEGWKVPQVPPDAAFRHSLETMAASSGIDAPYQELMKVDPAAAQKIDPRNVRRVIRALEVYHQTKTPISRLQYKKTPPFNTLIIGLTADRAELYRLVDQRIDKMIEQGLVAEVKKLLDMGYGWHLPAMSSIGYRQIGMFLRGELGLETAIMQIKFETHRFVRHQNSWFRLTDNRIRWFDLQKMETSEIEELVAEFIDR